MYLLARVLTCCLCCSEHGQIAGKDFLNMDKLEKEKLEWITAPNTDGERKSNRFVQVLLQVQVCVGEWVGELKYSRVFECVLM